MTYDTLFTFITEAAAATDGILSEGVGRGATDLGGFFDDGSCIGSGVVIVCLQ